MNAKLDQLTRITDRWTPIILMAVMGAAFILSYAALLSLAIEAGYVKWLAWLWPLLLDGVVIYAAMSLVKRQFAGQPTRYIWCLLVFADGLSIGLNGYAAWPNIAYTAIHAAPPLVLVLLMKAYTNDAKDDARQAEAIATLADLRAQAEAEAAKLADLGARIATQTHKLEALKDETRHVKKAANGAISPLNGVPVATANEAKQARIEARREMVADLWKQGLSRAEIASQLKDAGHAHSSDTIGRDLKALGLADDGPEVADIVRDLIGDLDRAYQNGKGNGKGVDHG